MIDTVSKQLKIGLMVLTPGREKVKEMKWDET